MHNFQVGDKVLIRNGYFYGKPASIIRLGSYNRVSVRIEGYGDYPYSTNYLELIGPKKITPLPLPG